MTPVPQSLSLFSPELISCPIFSTLPPHLPHPFSPTLTQAASFPSVTKACSVSSLQFVLCTSHPNKSSGCVPSLLRDFPRLPIALRVTFKIPHLHIQDPCDLASATFFSSKSTHCFLQSDACPFIKLLINKEVRCTQPFQIADPSSEISLLFHAILPLSSSFSSLPPRFLANSYAS